MDDFRGLSVSEKEGIEELKARLGHLTSKYKTDSSMYIRFLRARNGNLNKAEEMLRNHLEWRKKNKIDDIDIFKPPLVSKYFSMNLIGLSKAALPVRYLNFGNMDIKGMLKSSKVQDCLFTVVQKLESDAEKMIKISQMTGRQVEKWIYIFDFENYTFSKATHKETIQMIASIMSTYEAHYPERLNLAFIINASIYFTLIFSIIKPLFTGATLSKIKIFGKEGWKEELMDLIDAEELPVFLGGTRTDVNGDPFCSSFINHGGLVPESYYFINNPKRLCNQVGVKKLLVSRKSKVDLVLDVDEPGSHIEWEFETESRDIGFGLYFKALDSLQNTLQELIPNQRVEAHINCETGVYQCEYPGTYILMFDNSYSWLQQKEVFCRAIVVRPSRQIVSSFQNNTE